APAPPASAGPMPPGAAGPAPRAPSAGSAGAPLSFPGRPGFGPRPDHRQHRQREQRQRDVPVPARPRPHLVLVQTAVPLGPLEPLLDRPPRPGDPDQLAPRGGGRPATGVVRPLLLPLAVAPHQEPELPAPLVDRPERLDRPVVPLRPLRARPGAGLVPGPLRQPVGDPVHP